MTSTGVTNTVVTDIGMTKAGMTGAGRAANRVKPPLPGTSGGILGTAFAREPVARLLSGLRPFPSQTPRQELHPHDDGH